MQQFSLEKWLENTSRKVVTRSGHNVRILCTDQRGNMPIVALVEFETLDGVQIFYSDGKNESHREYDLFFADEEFTEFEKALLAAFNCVAGKAVTTIGTASFQEDVDKWSKPLIDLAIKEIREEQQKKLGTLEMPIDITEPYYIKGKQDALKDLPKWKDVSGKNGAGTKDYKIVGYYLVKGNYAIYLEDLDKLPKE